MVFGKLICKLLGHKRRVLADKVTSSGGRTFLFYRCPRCNDEVRRIKREGK